MTIPVAGSPESTPLRRRLRIDWFMVATTVVATVVFSSIAGGYWCTLVLTGGAIAGVSLLFAWPLRQWRVLPWVVGLATSAALAWLLGVVAVYASHDATSWRVFGVTPPPRIRFVSAERSVALSDGAGLVVVDDFSRAELEPLLVARQFSRESDREARIAASANPRRELMHVASGTNFLIDATPTPSMEVYRSVQSPDYWSYVVYFPETERAYAFWLEF